MENIGEIIIIFGAAIIVLLLTIIILIKTGLIGEKNYDNNKMKKITFSGGKNIDSLNGIGEERGLTGFGEDRSETLVIGVTAETSIPFLVEFVDLKTGKTYSGYLRDRLVVGRNNVNHLSDFIEIPDNSFISKTHVELLRSKNIVYIRDLGSLNHTWINQQYLSDIEEVNDGDQIQLGRGNFIIRIKMIG